MDHQCYPSNAAGWRNIRAGRARKPSISAENIAEIVRLTTTTHPAGATHWSCRTMAKQVGVSSATVQRVWSDLGLKPHRHTEFLKSLNTIDCEVPKGLQVHLILDNYSTHKHAEVVRWLNRHKRFHLHFTPTSSSWLNQVERWFRDLTDKNLRRGIVASVPELIASIEEYLNAHNADPKPYVWTATAESILAKVQRARTKLERVVNQN
jgi:transposase